jgi:hypothetical protein
MTDRHCLNVSCKADREGHPMLIHLPNNHPPTGTMMLDYRQAEYDLARYGLIGLRYGDEIGWQYREINAVVPGNGSITYVCGPAGRNERHEAGQCLKNSRSAGAGLNTKPDRCGQGRSR